MTNTPGSRQKTQPLLFNMSLSSHLLISLLLIALGIGNIVFGNVRQHQMNSTSIREENDGQMDMNSPLPIQPDLNLESKERRKLEHRLNFYSFVMRGGAGLVAVGTSYLSLLALWQILGKAEPGRK
jgi:hypothetical protein